MNDIKIRYLDDSHAYIDSEHSILMELWDYFSFQVEGYRFNPKYKGGIWDGKIRLFNLKNQKLPQGLVKACVKFAEMNSYTYEMDEDFNNCDSISDEFLEDWFRTHPMYDGDKQIQPYWYQQAAIKEALTSFKCLVDLPTSAGKSYIIAVLSKYFLENYNKKVLVLVPTTTLVNQMQVELINYRIFKNADLLGIRSGTEKNSNAKVYISTWQSACKQPKSWLAQFGMLLTDEVHLGTAKSLSEICSNMTDCKYKIGLSGSIKDSKAHITQLIGLYGPRFKPTSTAELMVDEHVTKMNINVIDLNYNEADKKLSKGLPYKDEIKFLLAHKRRNFLIAKLAIQKPDKNTIVLFKARKHGELLFQIINKLLEGTNRKVYYIDGTVHKDIRDSLKDKIENEIGSVVVASYGTSSTGWSVKNLHRGIFAHPTKSKVINLQSIGRLLRKHISKDVATLYDFIDNLSIKKYKNFAMKHAIERVKLYAREQFNYKILKAQL